MADFKFAFRQLRRSPAFAVTAVLTLALGIGANTAIFSLVDSILLRPLPFAQQDRLIRITGDELSYFPKGWIRALGEHATALESLSGFGADTEFNIAQADTSDRVFGAQMMVNGFDTLGIHPAIGRFFTADDAVTGHDQEVVLSYGYWRQHFAASPAAVGTTLRIDGVPRRIIGVMPAGVHFPYADTQFVIPVAFKGGDAIDPWNNFSLLAFGRLKNGATPLQAQAEMRRLHNVLLPLFPWRMPDLWAGDMTVVPLLEAEVGATRPRLLLLFGAVGLILLIACANVANLMLARAAGREREMAIRGALGASGWRLMRQLLAESVLLAVLAGAAGVIVAAAGLRALVSLLPADTPRLAGLGLHWPVFLFAAAVSVLTGLLFGLIPALRMASPNLQGTLRSGSRSVAGHASQFRTSMLLVVGQIGLSVVVITAAGLMLHSLYRLSQVDPGFRADRIVTAEVSLDAGACKEKGRCQEFFATLTDALRGIPGTGSASLANALPMSGPSGSYVYDAEGHPRDPHEGAALATGRVVTPSYFDTLGMHLLEGRLFSEQDASGASRAVIINQHMAARLWPQQNPIGKHIIEVADEKVPAVWSVNDAPVIVGVAANTHEDSLAGRFGDEVWLPLTPATEAPVMYVLLRTRLTTPEAAAAIRRAVAGIDPFAPVTRVRTLNEVISASVSAPRSLTILLLCFGSLAVLIGLIGVYSLIAYIVSWRTREIGIRLALGARRWQIVKAIMRQSVLLALTGSVVGLAAAAAATRLLERFLYGVSALDPVTYCLVPVLMLALAMLAAWIPARRAAAVDPVDALRSE
ncbi:ABC transporter permease [Paracidobacterium acidisoli]|nr:ABC transporter permease [Paracidobacterium acidisoli]